MIPAKERLKKIADRLSDEDAAIVLFLARKLASRRRQTDEDAEDARDFRAAMAEAGEIPYDEYRRSRGA